MSFCAPISPSPTPPTRPRSRAPHWPHPRRAPRRAPLATYSPRRPSASPRPSPCRPSFTASSTCLPPDLPRLCPDLPCNASAPHHRLSVFPPTPQVAVGTRPRPCPPEGRPGKGGVGPGEATLLWLRSEEWAPESMKYGAPTPEPSMKPPFGRAPAESAPTVVDEALRNELGVIATAAFALAVQQHDIRIQ
jgi:hypothetical protein